MPFEFHFVVSDSRTARVRRKAHRQKTRRAPRSS